MNMGHDDAEPQQEPDGYTVGYGKPPVGSRFKKGKSGNPSGRPKKQPTFADAFNRALDRKVWVVIDGKRRLLSKREVSGEQWANKHALANVEALRLAAQMDRDFAPPPEDQGDDDYYEITLILEDDDPRPSWKRLRNGQVIDQGR